MVTNQLGLAPEIVHRSLLVRDDVTSGDENVIGRNTLATVGHVQSMVGNGACLVVGEAVEVPVGMAGKHDRSLLGGCKSNNLEIPVHAGQGIGDVGDNLSGETLLAIGVNDGEGDAGVGVRHNSEVAVVPAIRSAVESISALGRLRRRVVVGRDVILLAVNLERAVANTVGVSSGNTAKMGVRLVNAIVRSIIEASDDISGDTVLVIDQKIGDGGAIGNKGGLDAISLDPVFAILVGTLAFGRKGKWDESSNDSLEEHDCG